MPFTSLRSKLIVILILLLSLLALASGVATLRAMKQDSQAQARDILTVANKVLRQTLDSRAEQLSNSVSILAADFAFRRAVATEEQETIASVLQNHGNRINASLVLLLSPQGALLSSSEPGLTQASITPLFTRTASNTLSISGILPLNGKPYQLVLAQVKAPNLIAWVGMGFLLDAPLAGNIKQITGLDISFVSQQAEQIVLTTSTLDQQHQQLLPAQLPQLLAQPDTALSNTEQDYISAAIPLDNTSQLWAVQHLPNQRWISSYQHFRQQLLLIFGAALSLALLVAVVVARGITKPLKALTHFASRLGQGIDEPLPPTRGNDEVVLLSQTLSTMQQDIRKREQQLLFNAEHDSLTGCYNRTAFERLLAQQALDSGCLVQINLKDFKNINDALGFSNGDKLLQQLATRLDTLRLPPQLTARLGGDEFILWYSKALEKPQLQQLLQKLSQGYQLQGSQINLTLYAGVYGADSPELNVNDMLRRVHIALENARNTSEGIAWYQSGQDESHQRELTIIRDLPEALLHNQLYVVYQPKVDLASASCSGAEALIRWQHPQLGFVPPDQFIALAEHAGCIGMVTQWMLQQVIAQAASWWQQGHRVRIAINLSAVDLANPLLTEDIQHLLAKHQLTTDALALEVTESAVMRDTQQAVAQLNRLRDLGIKLSIDDFGTGQTSLAYLKKLPVHEVKIDRAFVKDIEHNSEDALIVAATTQLAHGLGFDVTAEGLENRAGLTPLLHCGCNTVQGYYFSKPMKNDDFIAWLQQFSANANQWFTPEAKG